MSGLPPLPKSLTCDSLAKMVEKSSLSLKDKATVNTLFEQYKHKVKLFRCATHFLLEESFNCTPKSVFFRESLTRTKSLRRDLLYIRQLISMKINEANSVNAITG